MTVRDALRRVLAVSRVWSQVDVIEATKIATDFVESQWVEWRPAPEECPEPGWYWVEGPVTHMAPAILYLVWGHTETTWERGVEPTPYNHKKTRIAGPLRPPEE